MNTASLGEDACVGSCSWTRSVENASSETLTWTVSFDGPISFTASISPSMFSLAPGASQEIEVDLDVVTATVNGEWRFGSVDFDETSGGYPDAHWPVAVVPASGNIPETLSIQTEETTGSVDMSNLVSIDITSMNLNATGLYTADRHEFTVVQEPDLSVGFPQSSLIR